MRIDHRDTEDTEIIRRSGVHFQAGKRSESAQARAELLTEKNKLGQLSQDEAAELEQMIRFNRLVALLKAKALRKLG